MTAAVPLPTPEPATAEDLGHPIRYPVFVEDLWRSACRCHWWQPVVGPEEEK